MFNFFFIFFSEKERGKEKKQRKSSVEKSRFNPNSIDEFVCCFIKLFPFFPLNENSINLSNNFECAYGRESEKEDPSIFKIYEWTIDAHKN